MAAMQEKILGQSRPSSTSAETIYTKPSDVTTIVRSIIVCNTVAATRTFRIFVDNDGATYDESTALFFDTSVLANETITIDLFLPMSTANGTIGVRTGTSNALNFTVCGVEIS